MTSPAPSAAPPNALLMWTDGRSIFVELPTKTGVPYIVTYQLNSKGLSMALGILRKTLDVAGEVSLSPIKSKLQTPQAAMAQALLRRKGMLK